MIGQWNAERDRLQHDNDKIVQALELCNPPAKDVMSVYQADALKKLLTEARKHHQAILDYAQGYLEKLEAARAAMARTEQDNADRLRTSGED